MRSQTGVGQLKRTQEIVEEVDPIVFFSRKLREALLVLWRAFASFQRIMRNDKPRGILPSTLTARPKGRGIKPAYEYNGALAAEGA